MNPMNPLELVRDRPRPSRRARLVVVAAASMCFLAAGGQVSSASLFVEPALSFDSGDSPQSVAIGDLNGDGRTDLVTANSSHSGNTVSVLLGDGTGAFGANTEFQTDDSPISVAIGDLNGDGRPDLATANEGYRGGTVSVLLGNGDGTFGANTEFGTGDSPQSVAIADLNGDGRPDLATANRGSSTVSVLLGDGTGAFGANTEFQTGDSPRSIAIGDLNGDGRRDLATANEGYQGNSVSVLLGNGNGTFGANTEFGTGDSPQSVAIADLNGDGRADLVTANSNHSGNTVSVLLGGGTGAFGANTEFQTGDTPRSVAIGDLNGDGRQDLATANEGYRGNSVSVLLGSGDGTFGANTEFGTGDSPQSVAIGDLNGDARADLVVANSGSNTVSVLLNAGALVGVPSPSVNDVLVAQIFPNPARGNVTIHLSVPRAGHMSLRIHDMAGRTVRVLAEGDFPAGERVVQWDRRTVQGAPVSPGMYFYELCALGSKSLKSAVILK